MTDYVVGDIQGCFRGLQKLLDKVDFNPSHDRLFAAGDLVARGPDSLDTLLFLHALGDRFSTVLGNHDLHFLAVSQGIKNAKSSDKLDTLLADKRLPQLIDWLRAQPLAIELDEHTLLTHAGLYPDWSIKQATALSGEVSQILRSKDWLSLLNSMYGNQPDVWSVNLSGPERHRFIVNAFTRMRYLQGPHTLEFDTKCAPGEAPEHLTPWFALTNENLSRKQRVLFGHWAALMGQTSDKRFVALDTGYVWGNTLTAINLTTNMRISVSA